MPDDERVRREMARTAIRRGKLPSRRPDRTFSGSGTRVVCSVCKEFVTSDQTEMEIEFRRHGMQPGSDRHFLHVRCLAASEFERTKIDVVTTGVDNWPVGPGG